MAEQLIIHNRPKESEVVLLADGQHISGDEIGTWITRGKDGQWSLHIDLKKARELPTMLDHLQKRHGIPEMVLVRFNAEELVDIHDELHRTTTQIEPHETETNVG